MSVEIVTFGCRLNAFESEVIAREAERAGLTDTIVINSCAVTNEAVAQARQSIRRLKRERPRRGSWSPAARRRPRPRCSPAWPRSIACSAMTTRCAARPGAPRARRSTAPQVRHRSQREDRGRRHHGGHARWRRICWRDFRSGLPRVFVQVQNGCDHRCTFCIIPYGRGNSRSVPMGAVVDQVRALVERGHAEIVLTGVDLTSYGADLPGAPKLGQLTKQILRHVPELKRLRISSIDSIEVDRDLLDVIADDERLMPHLHLSLQSGDDLILKRMKRRHSRAATRSISARRCGGCGRTSRSAPISSRAFRPRPRRCSRARWIWWRNAVSPSCMCFPIRRGRARRRRGCRRSRATRSGSAPSDCGRPARRRCNRRLASEIGATRQVLIESATQGRTEHFIPVAISGETPGAVRALHDHRT